MCSGCLFRVLGRCLGVGTLFEHYARARRAAEAGPHNCARAARLRLPSHTRTQAHKDTGTHTGTHPPARASRAPPAGWGSSGRGAGWARGGASAGRACPWLRGGGGRGEGGGCRYSLPLAAGWRGDGGRFLQFVLARPPAGLGRARRGGAARGGGGAAASRGGAARRRGSGGGGAARRRGGGGGARAPASSARSSRRGHVRRDANAASRRALRSTSNSEPARGGGAGGEDARALGEPRQSAGALRARRPAAGGAGGPKRPSPARELPARAPIPQDHLPRNSHSHTDIHQCTRETRNKTRDTSQNAPIAQNSVTTHGGRSTTPRKSATLGWRRLASTSGGGGGGAGRGGWRGLASTSWGARAGGRGCGFAGLQGGRAPGGRKAPPARRPEQRRAPALAHAGARERRRAAPVSFLSADSRASSQHAPSSSSAAALEWKIWGRRGRGAVWGGGVGAGGWGRGGGGGSAGAG